MDSLTHTVLGACVGEAIAGKKLGKKAMLWGAIANNAPDIDVLSSSWMDQPDSLLAHRGFTHSILFAFIFSLLTAWLMTKADRKKSLTFSGWSLLIGLNVFLHIIIDSFTAYGTGWFEPFSHHRVSFNMMFVADPFFTLPILIVCISLLVLKRKSARRLIWITWGLMLSFLYSLYAFYHKIEVNDVVKQSLKKNNILYSDFMATPTPLNNFLWYIAAANDSGYYVGYYSVFDRSKDISFHFVPRNESLIRSQLNTDEVKKLIRFSQGYYCLQQNDKVVVFSDMRFGQIGGWDSGNAPFVFQYRLIKNAYNSVIIQSGRFKASSGEALSSMIRRIKGN